MGLEFTESYLNGLAHIKTPSDVTLQDSDECYDYCQLRNFAKGLLTDRNDERAKKELSRLVVKLGVGALH